MDDMTGVVFVWNETETRGGETVFGDRSQWITGTVEFEGLGGGIVMCLIAGDELHVFRLEYLELFGFAFRGISLFVHTFCAFISDGFEDGLGTVWVLLENLPFALDAAGLFGEIVSDGVEGDVEFHVAVILVNVKGRFFLRRCL